MDKEAYIKKLFLEDIERQDSKGSHIMKDDIVRIAEEYGINFKPREAKETIINKIIQAGFYERLFNDFKEFIYIPVWKVAEFYKLNNEQINQLKEIGVITAEVKQDAFYSKDNRDYVYYNKYSLDVFNYSPEGLLKAYNEAYGQEGFKVRIETKTEEELSPILELLKGIAIINNVKSYEHRNQQGYYNYFTMEILNNSEVEGNRLLNDIEKLKAEIKQLKEAHKEGIEEINKKWCEAVGVNSFIEAKRINNMTEYYKRRIDTLEGQLRGYKEQGNIRGAGRKPKFTGEQIQEVLQDRAKGLTMKQLAIKYNCGAGTVHKIIHEYKEIYSK